MRLFLRGANIAGFVWTMSWNSQTIPNRHAHKVVCNDVQYTYIYIHCMYSYELKMKLYTNPNLLVLERWQLYPSHTHRYARESHAQSFERLLCFPARRTLYFVGCELQPLPSKPQHVVLVAWNGLTLTTTTTTTTTTATVPLSPLPVPLPWLIRPPLLLLLLLQEWLQDDSNRDHGNISPFGLLHLEHFQNTKISQQNMMML